MSNLTGGCIWSVRTIVILHYIGGSRELNCIIRGYFTLGSAIHAEVANESEESHQAGEDHDNAETLSFIGDILFKFEQACLLGRALVEILTEVEKTRVAHPRALIVILELLVG